MQEIQQPPTKFAKIHAPLGRLDWHRVIKFYQASQESTAYRTPEPLEFDPRTGIIVYEHLPPGRHLHYFTARNWVGGQNSLAAKAMAGVGRALAGIHKDFRVNNPDIMRIDTNVLQRHSSSVAARIQKILDASPVVCHHGDFGPGNIWLANGDRDIWIFDPIPSWFCPNGQAGQTTLYYDIGQMIAGLTIASPFWFRSILGKRVLRHLIETFVRGYEASSSLAIDRQAAFGVSLSIVCAFSERDWVLDSGRLRLWAESRLALNSKDFLLKEINFE